MDDLTSVDFALMAFIGKHEPVDRATIEKKLHKKVDSLDYRLETLTTPQYSTHSSGIGLPIKDTAYIKYKCIKDKDSAITTTKKLGVYSLSRLGRKALQDYNVKQKSIKRENWFKSVWCPILVSLATNLALYGIPRLLQLIQGWLSHTP